MFSTILTSQNPTRWLDALLVVLFLLFVILTIATSCLDPSPRRGKTKFWATLVFGSFWLLSGCDGLLTPRLASKSFSTGTITHLERHGGKNPSSTFTLTDTAASQTYLRIDSNSEFLQLDVVVKVEWLTYNHEAMRIDFLDGPHSGEHLNDGQAFSACLGILFGIWMVSLAYKERRSNPNAIPQSRSSNQAPLSGFDEKSLLNLNKH